MKQVLPRVCQVVNEEGTTMTQPNILFFELRLPFCLLPNFGQLVTSMADFGYIVTDLVEGSFQMGHLTWDMDFVIKAALAIECSAEAR